MDDSQREYYLREQLKVISSQLNNGVSPEEEIQEFRDKIAALPVDDASKEKLLRECDRLERYAVQSPEAAVSRNYLETCLNSHGANIQKITSTLPAPTRYLRRITTAQKGQGAHTRIHGGALARARCRRPDNLPRRPSRSRQDLGRKVGRTRYGQKICPHISRRRP